jgi:hypothetical protein
MSRRAVFDDRLTQGHLAIAREHGTIAVTHGEDRRGMDHLASVSPERPPA